MSLDFYTTQFEIPMPPQCEVRRIYRIENEEGVGPYGVSWGYTTNPHLMASDPLKHPSPHREPELGWNKVTNAAPWFFGFDSMEALKRWFDEPVLLEAMEKRGFLLTIYEVPAEHCRISRAQAIFIKAKATKVAELPLLH